MTDYLRAPLPSRNMPAGIPYIIGNEAAERFSFYGMRAILVVFMTQYLLDGSGVADPMNEEEAKGWFHLFVSAVYITPLLGALISDGLLGKYRTIITLSLVYCLGHFVLALDHTRLGLLLGLGLIALGSGGIKPCVSAHLGDQFGRTNAHLLPRAFGWFYFAINLGAFFSILATPWLLREVGPSWAFGVPGVLMVIATLLFWAGRHRFVHIPPGGWDFVRETLSRDGLLTLARLLVLYLFVAVFWALYDQSGSAWVLQAQSMDRNLFGIEILPAQIQAANPLLVILLVPTFSYLIYPAIQRRWRFGALPKIGFGMLLAAVAFAISGWAQHQIDLGQTPSVVWQLFAYLVLTSGEVMVSITCLEFSYTQAPNRMKSFVMAFFMMSIALGNLFTSMVNFAIEGRDLLQGADYYLFFCVLMLATTGLYFLVSRYIPEQSRLQSEAATGAS
ncbi:MAG: POT family MFS transporter [Candidatus Thiodiazotropha sp.]|nr:POT family MFS transporter [Candidatus Thiodiazotropha taylori]PUB76039.1 MAG: MFS transporter [gamma proteobacterium symbiont of Ctena orbiculata]